MSNGRIVVKKHHMVLVIGASFSSFSQKEIEAPFTEFISNNSVVALRGEFLSGIAAVVVNVKAKGSEFLELMKEIRQENADEVHVLEFTEIDKCRMLLGNMDFSAYGSEYAEWFRGDIPAEERRAEYSRRPDYEKRRSLREHSLKGTTPVVPIEPPVPAKEPQNTVAFAPLFPQRRENVPEQVSVVSALPNLDTLKLRLQAFIQEHMNVLAEEEEEKQRVYQLALKHFESESGELSLKRYTWNWRVVRLQKLGKSLLQKPMPNPTDLPVEVAELLASNKLSQAMAAETIESTTALLARLVDEEQRILRILAGSEVSAAYAREIEEKLHRLAQLETVASQFAKVVTVK